MYYFVRDFFFVCVPWDDRVFSDRSGGSKNRDICAEEFQEGESPSDDAPCDDHFGYAGRLCRRISHLEPPPVYRLSGYRFRIRILLSFEYLHHRIQGRRTGNHRPSCQHLPRDSHPAVCSAVGKILRQTGTYQCRWSYDHGYNVAYHHPIFGREFHHRFHLPWFLCRLFCTLPSYLLLFFVEITKSSFKPNPYETYFQFIHDMSEPVLCPYLSSPCGSERLYAVCLFQRASVVPEPYEGIFHDFFGIPLKSI